MEELIERPYKIRDINLDNILYSEVKGSNDKKCIFLSYDDPNKGKNRLLFQTTELFNINNLKKKKGYYELDLPIAGNSEKRINEFHKFLLSLDDKFVMDGRNNSNEWFTDKDNIVYKSIIRTSSTDEEIYNKGIIRLKLIDTPAFKTRITRNGNTVIHPSDIRKNSLIKIILECYALWISEDGYGL